MPDAMHTPEPWRVEPSSTGKHGDYKVVAADGLIARVYVDQPNARRIVACVNACKGWPVEELEGFDSAGELSFTSALNRETAARLKAEADNARLLATLEAERTTSDAITVLSQQLADADAACALAVRERDGLLKWLEAISNEADEFDDHDGKCGHISYGTLMQARAAIEEAKR